jgi:hypothetical protein
MREVALTTLLAHIGSPWTFHSLTSEDVFLREVRSEVLRVACLTT